MSHLLGSVEVGKLADLVLYRPENFGTKPEVVIKGGQIAWAQMGDANASIPTVQPIYGRPMYACKPEAAAHNSISFVSAISIESGEFICSRNQARVVSGIERRCASDSLGTIARFGLAKRVESVRNCRNITKRDMKLNDALPKITVDPETYVLIDCPTASLHDSRVAPSLYQVTKVIAPPLPSPHTITHHHRYDVVADGVLCTVPAATSLPLTQVGTVPLPIHPASSSSLGSRIDFHFLSLPRLITCSNAPCFRTSVRCSLILSSLRGHARYATVSIHAATNLTFHLSSLIPVSALTA